MIPVNFKRSTIDKLENELVIASHLNNLHLYQIIQSQLWIAEQKSISWIADILKVSCKTIYNWFWNFLTKGFSWLFGKHYKGRGVKSKLSSSQKKELYDMVKAGPEECGFDCGLWNSALIAELIFLKFGVKYNLRYLCRLLKKLGLSYQKACFASVRKDEEEYQKARDEWKKKIWPKILKEAKAKNSVILFGDEVSFAMWGSLAYTWSPIGKQPEVKTKGIRKGLKMFGAIEFNNGDFQYMESLSYSLSPKSLKKLKNGNMPVETLKTLKGLKGETYTTKQKFVAALIETIGKDQAQKHQTDILKYSETAGKFNGDTYIKFLEQLLNNFSSNIILIEDGAPYHTSKIVEKFKSENKKRLSIYPLPSFSPDFNPIEKLWKNTKRDATHLKYFETFEALRKSVVKAFKKYMNDATKIICVMDKLRTQAGLA